MPMSKAVFDQNSALVLRKLFSGIAKGFVVSGALKYHKAPSLFVIYAHDTGADGGHGSGDAEAKMVRSLIDCLSEVGSKAFSDQNPVLNLVGATDQDLQAVDDILTNQFCLLPQPIARNHVDKVILVCSGVLKAYCTNEDGKRYVSALRELIRHCVEQSAGAASAQAQVRQCVDAYTAAAGFHHVLTELAMVEARVVSGIKPLFIVPIMLQGTDLADWPFLSREQYYHSYRPKSGSLLHPTEATYRLFFQLLTRIYDRRNGSIRVLCRLYEQALQKLRYGDFEELSYTEFEMNLALEVFDELHRVKRDEPLDGDEAGRDVDVDTGPAQTPTTTSRRFVPRPLPKTPPTKRQKGNKFHTAPIGKLTIEQSYSSCYPLPSHRDLSLVCHLVLRKALNGCLTTQASSSGVTANAPFSAYEGGLEVARQLSSAPFYSARRATFVRTLPSWC
jgi:hypothetical protein